MPMYDFSCPKCQNKFEELVRNDEASPACPACGSETVKLPSIPGPAKTGPTPFPYKTGPVHPIASKMSAACGGGGCGGGGGGFS